MGLGALSQSRLVKIMEKMSFICLQNHSLFLDFMYSVHTYEQAFLKN